jgi:hypothetical protein
MSVEGIFGVASLFGLEEEIQRVIHERSPKMKRQIRTDLQGKTTKREADPAKLAPDKTQGLVNNERTVESELPQGRGESLVTQLDSAVNQAVQRPIGRLRPREGATNRLEPSASVFAVRLLSV